MNGLRATAIEELCHSLGLRTPIGVLAGSDITIPVHLSSNSEPATKQAQVAHFSDEQLTALGVLAQPESIAVVTHWPAPQPFAPPIPVVHILATRGPWLAEHVIEGEAHHLHAADADNAAILLLDRCGLVDDTPSLKCEPVNVTLAAYRRMTELIRASDYQRATAALIGDGAGPTASEALVEAVSVGRTEVAGICSDGRRFVGCDLAFAGDATTGRWMVPASQHVDALPRHAIRHPSMSGRPSDHVRVLIEPVAAEALRDELSLVFGDA